MPPLRLWKKWLSTTFSSSRRESLYVFCPYSDLTLVKHTVPAFTGIFYTCQPQDGSSSYFPAPFSLYAVYLQQRLRVYPYPPAAAYWRDTAAYRRAPELFCFFRHASSLAIILSSMPPSSWFTVWNFPP